MITSVYLSNNNIQAVTGRQKGQSLIIEQICEMKIPEGSLINGVITSEEELREELEDFWKQYNLPKRDVALVVSSFQFISKSLQLPKMPAARLKDVLVNEFADARRLQDCLYDYMDVTKNKKSEIRDIVGIMVERNFVTSYVEMFERMGIKLSSFSSSYMAEIQMLRHLSQADEATRIVLLMDGDNLTTILWEEGLCVYHNRVRLFSDHGTADLGVEIVQCVNRMIQFHQTRQRERIEAQEKAIEEKDKNNPKKPGTAEIQETVHTTTISGIYLGGIPEEDHLYCFQGLQTLGMPVEYLENGGSVQMPPEDLSGYFCDFFTAIGNLYPGLNLLKQYRKFKQENDRLRMILRKLMPIFVTFGICAVICLAIWIPNWLKQRKLNDINEYLNDPVNIAQVQKSDDLSQENDWLLKRIKEAQSAGIAIDSYPILNSEVEQEIAKCAGDNVTIQISSFYADNGGLTMETTAENAEDINKFIETLRRSELFWKVEYTGYSYVEGRDKYNINVTCYLESQTEETTGQEDENK